MGWMNLTLLLSLVSVVSYGLPGAEVIPEVADRKTSRIVDNTPFLRVGRGLRVVWNLRCFGANLRSSYSTIGPDSLISVSFKIKGNPRVRIQAKVRELFEGVGSGSLQYVSVDPDNIFLNTGKAGGRNPLQLSTESSRGARVIAQLNDVVLTYGSVDAQGNYDPDSSPIEFEEPPRYEQAGIAVGGSLRNYHNHPQHQVTDPAGGEIVLNSLLAGQSGYCGSFVSPLMLFFGDKRPHFSGTSQFPLDPFGRRIYWVEPKAPGYFLARDLNGNHKIDDAKELFGNASQKNGFEALKALDSNRDNQIDANDKAFSELLLWKDRNGDGISQKEELQTATRLGLQRISLKYNQDAALEWSNRASAQQFSSFTFKDGRGTLKKGEVIDIWFNKTSRQFAKHP